MVILAPLSPSLLLSSLSSLSHQNLGSPVLYCASPDPCPGPCPSCFVDDGGRWLRSGQKFCLVFQELGRMWRPERGGGAEQRWGKHTDHTGSVLRRDWRLGFECIYSTFWCHKQVSEPLLAVAVSCTLTATYWKPIPIRKLAVQLEQPATAMAAGLGPCEKSSATKNQGMGPGPTSKKATKPKIAIMLR